MRSEDLNDAQREAVAATEGPVLVLAGAGTGKTRVITYRVARLLDNGVPPAHVLAVTFTNKAAREMLQRVRALLGRRKLAGGPTVCTFHRLGLTVLREHAECAGRRRAFSIYDQSDCTGVIRDLLSELVAPDGPADPEALQRAVSAHKNAGGGEPEDAFFARLLECYERDLAARNAFDLDDLIRWPVRLLADKALGRAYHERYRYILVDEYQDTNQMQYELLRLLVGPERHICVVGDDDQSIYRFRGACRDKILNFKRDFPGAKVVKLEENYRSTNAILKAANAVIAQSAKRHAKRLFSRLGEGDRIRCLTYADAAAEAEGIVDEIRERHALGALKLKDAAILLRSIHQARAFEERLRFRDLPYTLSGGKSWFDRKEVRDTIAYLRLLVNRKDDAAFLRVANFPRRGIGEKALGALVRAARERGQGLSEVIENLAEVAGIAAGAKAGLGELAGHLAAARRTLAAGRVFEGAWHCIGAIKYREAAIALYPDRATGELRAKAVDAVLFALKDLVRKDPRADLAEFLRRMSLDNDADRDEEERREGINLMTLHSAKGLEFDTVYIPGLEEGILPHEKSIAEGDDEAIEEERRLLYVGMTRARRSLAFSFCDSRTRWGDAADAERSRFFADIPPDLLAVGDPMELDRTLAPDEGLEYFRKLRTARAGARKSGKSGDSH